ncbi:phosphatidate cytidylyltransferase [Aquirufa regiilacus]|uniref:Phosphatidate cytidylyltransferase n=1 Tax=Aquirufa regiilacus TaxID=3024868 RepID=A0ABU3TP94_9BACT|nr:MULTISPECIES: phosphatidate cytidylyltransferase [unclassified Aquirufa]MDT8887069.1 phosphatidate cytidylyltransferase [Aquirufa sp. LEPPI-3A]MDU0807654.1 phosphatidate cytidylyltransferase [Aquirufa sp. LEOWEIH-7C]
MGLRSLSNLQQRVIAAIIAIPFLLFCVLYSDYTFLVLFLVIGILAQLEFYKLVGSISDNLPLTFYGTFCGVVMHVLTFFIEKGDLAYQYYYILSPLLTFVFFIKLYKSKDEKPFKNIAYTFLGIIYVALPFTLLTVLAFIKNDTYDPNIVLGCLFLLWASDSGAYFAGTKFGKTKLFERVSPKKSWEGSIGGMLTAMVVATIISHYYTNYSAFQWYAIGIIIVIAGTYGDLVESLFKRSINIKDSADTIPGHGGFLDRFDGLLLSIPFIIPFVKLFP